MTPDFPLVLYAISLLLSTSIYLMISVCLYAVVHTYHQHHLFDVIICLSIGDIKHKNNTL